MFFKAVFKVVLLKVLISCEALRGLVGVGRYIKCVVVRYNDKTSMQFIYTSLKKEKTNKKYHPSYCVI